MVVVWILSQNGYHDGDTATAAVVGAVPTPSVTTPELATAAFHIMYGVPAVCGLVQLLLWSSHDLRGGKYASAAASDSGSDSTGSPNQVDRLGGVVVDGVAAPHGGSRGATGGGGAAPRRHKAAV